MLKNVMFSFKVLMLSLLTLVFVSSQIVAFADSTNIIQFNAKSYRADENGGKAIIKLSRTNPEGESKVKFVTNNATGIDGVDYKATIGEVQFLNGETEKTFEIPMVFNEQCKDPYKTVKLVIYTPDNAVLGTQKVSLLYIMNSDKKPANAVEVEVTNKQIKGQENKKLESQTKSNVATENVKANSATTKKIKVTSIKKKK